MGNCVKGTRNNPPPPPTKSFEEHKIHKHKIHLAVKAGKDDIGEFSLGLKGGVDNIHDRIVVVTNAQQKKENTIPKILDIVKNNNVAITANNTQSIK